MDVEAAARGYFGKSASELSAAESATLAGLIKCPSTCSPRVAPAIAKAHRDVVLKNMLAMGTLPAGEYEAAAAAPITLVDERHDSYAPAHLDADVILRVALRPTARPAGGVLIPRVSTPPHGMGVPPLVSDPAAVVPGRYQGAVAGLPAARQDARVAARPLAA